MLVALVGQGLVVVVLAMSAWLLWGVQLWPFLYGGMVAMANAGLLVWRWRRGLQDYHCNGQKHLGSFHRSLMERFFVVIMLLAAGFAYGFFSPDAEPLPILTGFVVGQLAWVIAVAAIKTE